MTTVLGVVEVVANNGGTGLGVAYCTVTGVGDMTDVVAVVVGAGVCVTVVMLDVCATVGDGDTKNYIFVISS